MACRKAKLCDVCKPLRQFGNIMHSNQKEYIGMNTYRPCETHSRARTARAGRARERVCLDNK